MSPVVDGGDPGTVNGARRSRTVLVGFLGAVVRRMGNWMPVSAAVALLGQLDVDESSVRTAVFRLKQRGWLEPQTRAGVKGYVLTALATRELSSGDQVIWHTRRPAVLEDGWCMVNFSVPESARARRHQLRTVLTSLGFGHLGSALWIAPARMMDAATKAIEELGLSGMCAIFVAHHTGGQQLPDLIRRTWDLPAINGLYRDFVGAHQDLARRLDEAGTISGEEAFVAYLGAIEDWRRLPYRDPGLPREMLGEDWAAQQAGALFERLVSILEGRALAHAAAYWPSPQG